MVNSLTGEFVECCDCYTICPCWANDKPDEDHCSAIYVWTFDEGSTIGVHEVGNRSVVAASFHGSRGGSQSALYVDHALSSEARQALLDAFSGNGGDTLRDLSQLLGTIIDSGPARVVRSEKGGQWEILVEVDERRLAYATGAPAHMDGGAKPLAIDHSALHHELRLKGPVVVQTMERFEMAVAPLPGAPFAYAGRAGMIARFDYSSRKRT
jgi:hypothetical protein